MLSYLKEVQIVGEQNTGNNIREQQVIIPSFLLASSTGLTDAKVEVLVIDDDVLVKARSSSRLTASRHL